MTEGVSETPTTTTNIFLSSELLVSVFFINDEYASDQDAQIRVSIIGNYCVIILEAKAKGASSTTNSNNQHFSII